MMNKENNQEFWDVTDLLDENLSLIEIPFHRTTIVIDPNKNEEWTKARAKKMKNTRRRAGVDRLNQEQQNKIDIATMFGTLVKDWRGLRYDGRLLDFGKSEDRELFTKVAIKKPFIIDQIAQEAKQAGMESDEDQKNSGTSRGSGSGKTTNQGQSEGPKAKAKQ